MNGIIRSTNFEEVYDAVRSGDIALEDVEARFVDFKTSFQQGTLNMEFNDRNKDKRSCWLTLSDSERQQVMEGCSFPAFVDPIERWIAYSLQPKFALMRNGALRNHYAIDCDGSKSAEMVPAAINALYHSRTLWPDDLPADSSDTMNSFWTTYKRILTFMGAAKWQSRAKRDIFAEMTDKDGHLRPEFRVGKDDEQRRVEQLLRMFAHLTHTIGNFVPCDGSFNSGRYAATFDYWDITLEYVRDWYLNRQEAGLSPDAPDTSFNAKTLAACREWLGSFGKGVEGWNTFVKRNFLDAYMKTEPAKAVGAHDLVKGEQGTYVVRPFFPGHGFHHVLPQDDAECHVCLMHMIASIITRGNQMLNELRDDPCAKLFANECARSSVLGIS